MLNTTLPVDMMSLCPFEDIIVFVFVNKALLKTCGRRDRNRLNEKGMITTKKKETVIRSAPGGTPPAHLEEVTPASSLSSPAPR